MTELEASVAEAASILEELSVPYMLIGALAVAAWGEARATLDVDLSVWGGRRILRPPCARCVRG